MGKKHRLKYYISYSPIGQLEKVLVMSESLHSIKERTFVVQHVCIYEVWEALWILTKATTRGLSNLD